MQMVPWLIALVAVAALVPAATVFVMRGRRPAVKPLPTEWALTARPVFSTDERRVYRQLREALPHHIVLSKLPLVRFCQPNDPQEVRYWYELLGSIHVTFAICSANGRVLAAIDLDTDRGNSRRVLEVKQSVLAACRVRYLRCPVDNLPSIAELQLLVPGSGATRGPQPAPARVQGMRPAAAQSTTPARRRERATLWQDSNFFQDSFFAPDSRLDAATSSGGSDYTPSPSSEGGSGDPNDSEIGGVVVDPPRSGSNRH
jgi:hypothetical protein